MDLSLHLRRQTAAGTRAIQQKQSEQTRSMCVAQTWYGKVVCGNMGERET